MTNIRRLAGGATALGLILALQSGSAQAFTATILDHPLVGANDTFSRIETWSGPGNGAISQTQGLGQWLQDPPPAPEADFLGTQFSSSKIEVVWSNWNGSYLEDLTIKLHTLLPAGGAVVGTFPVGMADVFFSTEGDRIWDFGFDIFSTGNTSAAAKTFANDPANSVTNGTKGTLFSTPTFKTSQNWADDFNVGTNFRYGGESNICAGSTDADCDPTPGGLASIVPPTEVTGGSAVTGQQNVGVSESGDVISFTLAGINFDGSWNSLRVFWGTGWCSNDSIEGFAEVPIPAALPMLLAAIGGLGVAGWRRRNA